MTLAERYIFKIALVAFMAALVGLTSVIWMTQALREFDLLTTKGQSMLVFLTVTGLTIPSLVMLIAPFALFGAAIYALNKLNGDSELIVMSAAGLSPLQLLRPFLTLALIVSRMVGAISIVIMPQSFRSIRDLVTKIRADFLTRVVREGTFTTLDLGFVFHYRDRGPAGELRGVFMQDRRDPARISSYLAEVGQTVEIDGQNYLVLDKGSVQRQQPNSRDVAIIVFERYAIDLAQFAAPGDDSYKPRERSTWELLTLDPKDPQVMRWPGRFRAELHDRFSNPLYPLAAVMIAFAALGQARTTRQGRGAAILMAVLAFGALRLAGVGAMTMTARSAAATPLVYLVPALAVAAAAVTVFAPARLAFFSGVGARLSGALSERLARLAARGAK